MQAKRQIKLKRRNDFTREGILVGRTAKAAFPPRCAQANLQNALNSIRLYTSY